MVGALLLWQRIAVANMQVDNWAVIEIHQPPHALDAIEKTSQAHKDGVRTLYKFMSYPRDSTASVDNAELCRRVDALLRDGELYFATARELNDPFEASPHFQMPENSYDDTLEAFSRALRDVHAPKWGWSEEQILARETGLSEEIRSGNFQVRMTGLAQEWRESFRSEFPMCCLTATQDSTLMWSYYSGGHTGICIHFDATKPPFTNAERVIYSDQYPKLPLPIAELDPGALRTLAFLTKSLVWAHEHEYRLINMLLTHPPEEPTHILDDLFIWKTAQLAVIHPSFIVGVTIGASMQDEDVEKILRICHDRPLKIPVYKAKCKRNRFDLEFVQIA